MTFDFYAALIRLAVIFAHFFIGSPKRVLLWCLFCPFLHVIFVYSTRSLMIHTYDFDEEEYDKLRSESGSAGTFGTGLGGLLHGLGFPLGVMFLLMSHVVVTEARFHSHK